VGRFCANNDELNRAIKAVSQILALMVLLLFSKGFQSLANTDRFLHANQLFVYIKIEQQTEVANFF
jgi:hypothetical protein